MADANNGILEIGSFRFNSLIFIVKATGSAASANPVLFMVLM
jgi:hypothetical protein